MVDIAVLLALIAIVVAAFTVLPILVSAAQPVEARVNAPAYVAGTFNATIDVANVRLCENYHAVKDMKLLKKSMLNLILFFNSK